MMAEVSRAVVVLALCARNADEVQLVGGVAVEIRTDDGQRRASVVGDDLHASAGRSTLCSTKNARQPFW